jgi:hypothetical protein
MKDIIPAASDSPEVDFSEEILVLRGFSDRRLDTFLKEMRKQGIERIQLKAILTPTNCRWNSFQLYQEIRKEHETMTGQQPERGDNIGD